MRNRSQFSNKYEGMCRKVRATLRQNFPKDNLPTQHFLHVLQTIMN